MYPAAAPMKIYIKNCLWIIYIPQIAQKGGLGTSLHKAEYSLDAFTQAFHRMLCFEIRWTSLSLTVYRRSCGSGGHWYCARKGTMLVSVRC